MSIILRGVTSGADADVDARFKAQRASMRPPSADAYFRMAAISGLLTTIAAGSATAGHVFAARWGHASKLAMIHYFAMRWRTIAGFTAAQEMALDAFRLTGYTASHSSGTPITLTSPNLKKRISDPATQFTDLRIGAAAALTAGTHTLDTEPFLSDAFAELAAAATVHKGRFDAIFDGTNTQDHPLVLAQNEGIIVRNKILMGAGGTGRLIVEMVWSELDPAEWE